MPRPVKRVEIGFIAIVLLALISGSFLLAPRGLSAKERSKPKSQKPFKLPRKLPSKYIAPMPESDDQQTLIPPESGVGDEGGIQAMGYYDDPGLLPGAFNWRDQLPPWATEEQAAFTLELKNQAPYGTCGYFAGIAALESTMCIDQGHTFDFSEYYFIRCDRSRVINNVVSETCAPYSLMSELITCNQCPKLYTVLGVDYFGGYNYDLAEVKDAIYNFGPISGTIPGHEMLVVGWNDTTNSFLFKNSWGDYLPYWERPYSISTVYYQYTQYQAYNPEEKLYGKIADPQVFISTTRSFGMMKIIPEADGVINQVTLSFIAGDGSGSVEFYGAFDGTYLDPEDLIHSEPISNLKPGYKTFALSTPVAITKDLPVFVVMKLNGGANVTGIGASGSTNYYWSSDGTTWYPTTFLLGIMARVVPKDSDDDQMPDYWEAKYDHSLAAGCMYQNLDDAALDYDFDGIPNLDEYGFSDPLYGYSTDPCSPDTDDDGIDDYIESVEVACLDPLKSDSDGDGLEDGGQFGEDVDGDGVVDSTETSPCLADTDGDGLNDGQERTLGTYPLVADTDEDGISDGDEVRNSVAPTCLLNPLVNDAAQDPDGDTLSSIDEIVLYHSLPCLPDSDSDGLGDDDEVDEYTDPVQPDTDDDGLNDYQEVQVFLTDPLEPDSDGDAMPDGWEAAAFGCGVNANILDALYDPDQDGRNNLDEYLNQTDPCRIDTDLDGLIDDLEPGAQGLTPDSDLDGLSDAFEMGVVVSAGPDQVLDTNCSSADQTHDQACWLGPNIMPDSAAEANDQAVIPLTLGYPRYFITDPQSWDSDQDGCSDTREVMWGGNPNLSSVACRLAEVGTGFELTGAGNISGISADGSGSELGMAYQDSDKIYFSTIQVSETGTFHDPTSRMLVGEGRELGTQQILLARENDYLLLWIKANHELHLTRIEPDGMGGFQVGQDHIIETQAQADYEPITMATAGAGLGVAWVKNDGSERSLHFKYFPPDGSGWFELDQPNIVPMSTLDQVRIRYLSLAWTGSEFGLTWTDDRYISALGGGNYVYLIILAPNGAGGFTSIPEKRLDNNAYDCRNLIWAENAFEMYCNNNYGRFLIKVSSEGNVGTPRMLSMFPDLMVPNGPEYGVIWRGGHLTFSDIFSTGEVESNFEFATYYNSGISVTHLNGGYVVTGQSGGYTTLHLHFLSYLDHDGDGINDSDETSCMDAFNYDSDSDSVPDGYEVTNAMDPCSIDSDSDTMPDGWELNHNSCGLNPLLNDSSGDADLDGLLNGEELINETDPCTVDSDADGLSDHEEVELGTDPNDPDTDADGMSDGYEAARSCLDPLADDSANDPDADQLSNDSEQALGTNSCLSDTDSDGMPDGYEAARSCLDPLADDSANDPDADQSTNDSERSLGTDPCEEDTDSDTMTDGFEAGCTNPIVADLEVDTDSDGLDNGEEVTLGTSPCDSDSDNDGMADGWEVTYSLDPLDDDSADDGDEDGLSNVLEYSISTLGFSISPNDPDSDLDGLSDGAEVTVVVGPGPNGVLNTTAGVDDFVYYGVITVGDNKIPETTASGDDLQVIPTTITYPRVFQTDPSDPDSDADGVDDYQETVWGSDPTDPDVVPSGELLMKGGIDQDVRETSNTTYAPSLVMTDDGFGVAWIEYTGSQYDLYFTLLDEDGVPTISEMRIATRITNTSSGYQLAWTGSEFGLAYATPSPSLGIKFQRIADDGALLSNTTLQTTTSSPWDLMWLNGKYQVVYSRSNELWGASVNSSGDLVSEARLTTTSSVSNHSADLVWTGSEFGLSWSLTSGNSQNIYFARFSENWSRIGSELRITNTTFPANQVSLAWNGTEYGMVWHQYHQYPATYDLYFVEVTPDAEGGDAGTISELTDGYQAIGQADNPGLIWSGSEYGVVWQDLRDIYGWGLSFALISGGELSEHLLVTKRGGDDVAEANPAMVWSGERAALVWTVSPPYGNKQLAFGFIGDWDHDGDLLYDLQEIYGCGGTDEFNFDTDSDNVIDGDEDWDNDGLSNVDPAEPDFCNDDFDDDGVLDGAEVLTYGTNPALWDTDEEGIDDKWEIDYLSCGADPLDPDDWMNDYDEDGKENWEEYMDQTSPCTP